MTQIKLKQFKMEYDSSNLRRREYTCIDIIDRSSNNICEKLGATDSQRLKNCI